MASASAAFTAGLTALGLWTSGLSGNAKTLFTLLKIVSMGPVCIDRNVESLKRVHDLQSHVFVEIRLQTLRSAQE